MAEGSPVAVEAFLTRYQNPRSRQFHGYLAGGYADWLAAQGMDIRTAGEAEIRRYLDTMRPGRKLSSLDGILKSIRAYYKWAYDAQLIDRNPAAKIATFEPRRQTPKFLPVEDIRKMLKSARNDRDWAFIAILACCSIQQTELRDCDVSDFERLGDRDILHLRHLKNSERRRQPFTVLTPEIADVLERQLEGRGQGPLFVSRFGERIARSSGMDIVKLNAKRAALGYHVSPQMLTNSLPAIALQRGFSFRSVVRAMGIPDRRHSERWVGTAGLPTEDSASVRLAHLVTSDLESAEFLLLQAEALLIDTDMPEGFAVAAVGAIVERHLRALGEYHGALPVNDETKGITYFTGQLQGRKIISVTDARRLRALNDQRNDGAHGYFERIADGDGLKVLRDARTLIARYPLPQPPSE